jgi:hypothetical protein
MARSSLALGALAASGLLALACNVAIGGGAAALVGGSAVLASQCYDRVHITVRDSTGSVTCDARVSVIDAEGDARKLQPCYSAALTAGTWSVRAEKAGYTPMTTSVVIPEHDDCPYYTHSIDISLRPIGAPAIANQPADIARARAAAAAAETPPEPAPSGPPRRAFELLTPGTELPPSSAATAPVQPTPAAPAPAAPAVPSTPASPPPTPPAP